MASTICHKLILINSDGRRIPALPSARPLGNMTKRAATDARPGNEKATRRASGHAREKSPEDEMGEFEDAWEDEIDDDDAAHSDGVCV